MEPLKTSNARWWWCTLPCKREWLVMAWVHQRERANRFKRLLFKWRWKLSMKSCVWIVHDTRFNNAWVRKRRQGAPKRWRPKTLKGCERIGAGASGKAVLPHVCLASSSQLLLSAVSCCLLSAAVSHFSFDILLTLLLHLPSVSSPVPYMWIFSFLWFLKTLPPPIWNLYHYHTKLE